jgi:hypothetical protein
MMGKRVRITVTSKHIRRANRCAHLNRDDVLCKCPVALALKEQTGQRWEVYALGDAQMEGALAFLSDKVTRWIEDWDAGKDVSPISFYFQPQFYKTRELAEPMMHEHEKAWLETRISEVLTKTVSRTADASGRTTDPESAVLPLNEGAGQEILPTS